MRQIRASHIDIEFAGRHRALRRYVRYLLLVALILVPTVLPAESVSGRFNLRVYGLGLFPADETIRSTTASATESFELQLDDGAGFGLELEYLLTKWIGLELAASFGEYDIGYRLDSAIGTLTDIEGIATENYSLGANYHFRSQHSFQVFAGAFVVMSAYDDAIFLTEVGRRDKFSFDDDIGFGAKVGINVPIAASGRWHFDAQLRYISSILEGEIAGLDLDVNPWLPSVGVSYRF